MIRVHITLNIFAHKIAILQQKDITIFDNSKKRFLFVIKAVSSKQNAVQGMLGF